MREVIFLYELSYVLQKAGNTMENDNKRFLNVISILNNDLRTALLKVPVSIMNSAVEIVLRAERPLCIECPQKRYYITENGCVTDTLLSQSMVQVSKSSMMEVFQNICNYSVYSYQNEINNGYITLKGGHRAGVCGTAVIDNSRIVSIKDISTINIRIAREIIGCSDKLNTKVNPEKGVLICGEPCSGKTTLLRDYARELSYKYKVSLIDERNELSSNHKGVAQNDIGMCDVYDSYIKDDAITHAVRSMSPDIIVCDEISTLNDIKTIEKSVNSGVSFICTIHAKSKEELMKKDDIKKILNTGAFSQLVFLSSRKKVGEIESVINMDDFGGELDA